MPAITEGPGDLSIRSTACFWLLLYACDQDSKFNLLSLTFLTICLWITPCFPTSCRVIQNHEITEVGRDLRRTTGSNPQAWCLVRWSRNKARSKRPLFHYVKCAFVKWFSFIQSKLWWTFMWKGCMLWWQELGGWQEGIICVPRTVLLNCKHKDILPY